MKAPRVSGQTPRRVRRPDLRQAELGLVVAIGLKVQGIDRKLFAAKADDRAHLGSLCDLDVAHDQDER